MYDNITIFYKDAEILITPFSAGRVIKLLEKRIANGEETAQNYTFLADAYSMKKDSKNHKKLIWVARGIAAAVACYGIYAFWKRRIPEYLFLISHFVFFDFGENLIWFLLDYIAIMGLFVFITYYTCSVKKSDFL